MNYRPETQALEATEPNKRFLRSLKGLPVDRPPFWLMRQAGRYLPEYREVRKTAPDFVAFCLDPDKAAKVTLQPIERFRMDAAILFADILLIPHALGQRVRFLEGEGPRLDPIRTHLDLVRLAPDRLHERLGPVYETLRLLKASLPSDVALIGFAGAPWTVATYMVEGGGSADQKQARLWAYRDEDGFAALIDMVTAATIDYLVAQVEAGAEAVQLFDTWAGSLSFAQQGRWVIEPARIIRAALERRCPGIPVIGFPKGVGAAAVDYAERTGVDALGLDTGVPAPWAARALQPKLAVQGNLDPLLLVAGGRAMEEEASQLLRILGGGPYVFNLGHGVVPETPPDHVAHLSRLIRNWRP